MRKHTITMLILSAVLCLLFSGTALAADLKRNDIGQYLAAEEAGSVSGPAFDSTEKASASDAAEETLLGTFLTTGYSSSGSATASGSMPTAGHTVSADWSILPAGSRIRFGGSSVIYTVEDNGVAGSTVDVYYASYAEAASHGVQYREVYLVRKK